MESSCPVPLLQALAPGHWEPVTWREAPSLFPESLAGKCVSSLCTDLTELETTLSHCLILENQLAALTYCGLIFRS